MGVNLTGNGLVRVHGPARITREFPPSFFVGISVTAAAYFTPGVAVLELPTPNSNWLSQVGSVSVITSHTPTTAIINLESTNSNWMEWNGTTSAKTVHTPVTVNIDTTGVESKWMTWDGTTVQSGFHTPIGAQSDISVDSPLSKWMITWI